MAASNVSSRVNSSSDEDDVENGIYEDTEMSKSGLLKRRLKKSDEMSDDEDDETAGNAGWADAMLRVLKSGVKSAGKSEAKAKKRRSQGASVIMSRGKTDREVAATRIKKEATAALASAVPKDDFQIVRASGADSEKADADENRSATEKPIAPEDEVVTKSHKQLIIELKQRRLERKVWENLGHVKPDVTNREKERFLQRVATAGVVQLFNAVKQRQTTVETKLKKVGTSEIKREKVMKSMTKQDFLDVLKKATSIRDPPSTKESKTTTVDDDESVAHPTWKVLRDDYMMGAQMKDWDKASASDSDGDGDLGDAPTNVTKESGSESDFD